MRNVEALLLNKVLEVYHKERASLRNNIVHIPRVLERIGKLRRSETVHGVDDDLECEGQGLVIDAFLQEGGQGPIEQCSGSCILMVLDRYSGLLDLAETLSVSVSEEVERLAERVLIARELLTEIGVNEFTLRIPVLPEDDVLTVLVGRVVRSQTRQFGKHEAGLPVRMEVVEDLLCSNNIVIAVCRDFLPAIFGNILVPRKPELLVVQAKFDLPLLERHLGCCEVVHIGVGQVVCLDKPRSDAVLDDPLAQVI